MKEHGILFKQEMVRAIWAGNKTMTRRTGERWKKARPGDRLWVRETWCVGKPFDKIKPSKLIKPTEEDCLAVDYKANENRIWSKTDQGKWRSPIFLPRWASRISLDLIAVRQERLQDISEDDAKAEGAKKTYWFHRAGTSEEDDISLCGITKTCYKNGFATLWEKINGPGSWDKNPEVTVLEWPVFKGTK
jgi:hypothetical protein